MKIRQKIKISKNDKLRLEELEKILLKHHKDIAILSKTLKQHIEDANILIKEYRDGTLENCKNIKLIHNKIDQILNVKVNGSLDLAETLKTIYEATKKERYWTKWKKSTKEMLNTRPLVGKIVTSKLFPLIILLTMMIMTVPILNLLGIIHLTLAELFIGLFSKLSFFKSIFQYL